MSASESVTPRLCAEATFPASLSEARPISTHTLQGMLAAVEVGADFLACVFAILAAYLLDPSLYGGGHIQYPLREAVAVSLSVSLSVAILLHRNGAYSGSAGLLQIRETERAIRIPVQSLLAILPLTLLLNLKFSGAAFLVALVLVPCLLILQKQAFVAVIRELHARGWGVDRVIVYGIGDTGKRILSALSHSVRLGFYPLAVVTENAALDEGRMPEMGYRDRPSVPVQRGPITPALLNAYQCSTLDGGASESFLWANCRSRGRRQAGRSASRFSFRHRTRRTALDRVDRRRRGVACPDASVVRALAIFNCKADHGPARILSVAGIAGSSALLDCTLHNTRLTRLRSFRSGQGRPQRREL